MSEVTIEDPDKYRSSAPVDENGRVSVGKEFAGKNVEFAASLNDDGESDGDSE